MRNKLYLLIICPLLSLGKGEVFASSSDKPMMGWSSWNHFRLDINEGIVKMQAKALVELGLKEIGYLYVNIDEGFFGGRGSDGKILYDEMHFPNGMREIADYIHSMGLKAGIYTDAGANSCASHYANATIGVGMGLWGRDEEDINQYLVEWDFDFLKVDWCGGEMLGLDEELRYTEISQVVRNTKPDALLNVCRWKYPGDWVTQVADSWRISGDIRAEFQSIMDIVDLNAGLWRKCRLGGYNDMDMLQIGRGMSFEEDKTHFTMWCILHSPLILGNDLSEVSEETLSIIMNEEIIALNQSDFVYQARRLVDYGDLEVWGKPLTSTMSGIVAVTLLNRGSEESEIVVNIRDVGIDPDKGYVCRDLWTKEVFGLSTELELRRSVPPHGVVVIKIDGVSIPYNVYQFGDADSLKNDILGLYVRDSTKTDEQVDDLSLERKSYGISMLEDLGVIRQVKWEDLIKRWSPLCI